MGYKNRLTFTFSVLRGLKAGEPFTFTLQNVSCHRPSTPVGYFFYYHATILITTAKSLQIITIALRYTKKSRYHLRDFTLCQFVTH